MATRSPARLLLGFLVLGAGAWACSSSTSSSGGSSTNCQTAPLCGGDVQACATTADDGTCASMVYRYQGKDHACRTCTDCASAATELAAACGAGDGGGFDASGLDGGSGLDASAQDGGTDGGKTVSCGPHETCASGGYQSCATVTGSTCTATITFDDGASYTCSACNDCKAAAAEAAKHCGAPGTDAGIDAGDAGDVCGLPPTFHPEATAGVYCPFTAAGKSTCSPGQECCEAPPGSLSTCQPAGAACPIAASTAWQCEDAVDCAGSPAGAVCCGVGTVALDPTCGFHRGSGFTGSHCAASCGAGEVVICESQAQCAAGTCTPFKTQGLGLGACL